MLANIKKFGLVAAVITFQITNEPFARARALKLIASRTGGPSSPTTYQTVGATVAGDTAGTDSSEIVSLGRYLIASFPNLKQVAYCMLPDNVWRPLVVGDVTSPGALAVDGARHQLYVADPPVGKIFKYNLMQRSDGKLETDGLQLTALDGFDVSWLATNSIGDLYFTGKAAVLPPMSSYPAVFRLDAALIAKGNTLSPTEIYSRSNSGSPYPTVWLPSGIAVDSFYIYWGNMERGDQHGTIVKGSRMNVGGRSAPASLLKISTAQTSVLGMTSTGNAVFYLTSNGVFGVPKTQGTTITSPTEGLVAAPPVDDTTWDPKCIAWDGEGTAYLTDFTTGMVYSIPTTTLQKRNLTEFVAAPGVYGMAVYSYDQRSDSINARGSMWLTLLVTLAGVFARNV